MIIYRSLAEIDTPLRDAVVTIGNFDGVHLGHREIFRKLKREAAEIGGVSVVVTFDPHPLKVLSTPRSVTLINTVEEKITLIEASGVDYLVIIPFTMEFAAIAAEEFVRGVLLARLGMKRLVIGHDYAFGRNREGNVNLLRRLGAELDFAVEELAPITDGTVVYSSSLVRRMILAGEVADVVHFLGRNFSVAGRVVHGEKRGKLLGFPTANIATDKELIPLDGVYAVKVRIADTLYDAACNIGNNPTFHGGKRTVEVFIFDFTGELYGEEVRVYFFERLRGEEKFANVEELAAAIGRDVARCRTILAERQLVVYSDYLEGL
jgi:riboflavin kinase/FMN adenylyltransferase